MTLGDVKVGSTVTVTKIAGDSATSVVLWTWESQREASFISERLHRLVIRWKLQSVDMSCLSERQMPVCRGEISPEHA